MQWIEMHLMDIAENSIEIGHCNKFNKTSRVDLFEPYIEKKRSEMTKISLNAGDDEDHTKFLNGLSSNRA